MELPRKPGHAILIPEAQLSLGDICRLAFITVMPGFSLHFCGSWVLATGPYFAEVGCCWCHETWDVHVPFIGPISSSLTRLALQVYYQSHKSPAEEGRTHVVILSCHCLGMLNCFLHKLLCNFNFAKSIFGPIHHSVCVSFILVAS